jgi:hypothetical protein
MEHIRKNQSKCLDEYLSVDEWADEVLGPDYKNWIVGFGEGKLTNVREWYENSGFDDSSCQCPKCQRGTINVIFS